MIKFLFQIEHQSANFSNTYIMHIITNKGRVKVRLPIEIYRAALDILKTKESNFGQNESDRRIKWWRWTKNAA